jgi:hypothetical protein
MVDDKDDQPKVSLLFAVAAGACLYEYRTCHNGFSLPLAVVPGTNRVNQVMRRNLYFQRASKHRTNLDLFKLVVAFPVEVVVLRQQQSAFS